MEEEYPIDLSGVDYTGRPGRHILRYLRHYFFVWTASLGFRNLNNLHTYFNSAPCSRW